MRWIWTWLARLCLLAGLVGSSVSFAATEPFKEMSVADVAKRLHDKGVYVYDANGEKVYNAAHVPGATRVDFDTLSAAQLPKDKLATLIFYCKNTH